MVKMRGVRGDVLGVVILLVLVGAGIYFVLTYTPFFSSIFGDVKQFEINDGDSLVVKNSSLQANEEFPDGILFYDNIRYKSPSIGYHFEDGCDDERKINTRSAFQLLDDLTVLSFSEVDNFGSNGGVEVSCPGKNERPSQLDEGLDSRHYIAGEGGPTSVINTSKYYLILNGSIILYEQSKCDKPIVAVHEILHAIGFKHSVDKRSIMYSVSNCNQIVTDNIINTINGLYGDAELPDLKFSKVSAKKSGRYIDFDLEVLNAGLRDSNEFVLKVYGNGKQLSTYNIEGLEVGTGKIIKVQNLFTFSNIDTLVFSIDEVNSVAEIDEENNKVTLLVN